MTITHAILAAAAMRALRQWLYELGHGDGPIAPADGSLCGVYYLPSVRRLVHVKTAMGPSHPERATAAEVRALHRLAPRLGARAWLAHVIVRPNYHPSAIIWHPLPPGRTPPHGRLHRGLAK